MIAAGIEKLVGLSPDTQFRYFLVKTHIYGIFSYSFAVLAIHFFIWSVFTTITNINNSDGIVDEINFIGLLIAFACSIPIAILLSVIWSSILKSDWVSLYLARNKKKRESSKFSDLKSFWINNLFNPKSSIVWDFKEKLKYIGTIILLEEQENYIEIIFEDLVVKDYNENVLSQSKNTFIRIPLDKVRIDTVDD